MFIMMASEIAIKLRRETWARNFVSSTLPAWKALTYAPPRAIAGMIQVRERGLSPWKQKRRVCLRACHVRGSRLLSNAASSMTSEIGGFVS
jgi:hypothetical protein